MFLTLPSTDCRGHAANQLAPALGLASFDRNRNTIDCKCVVSGNDLVDTMWFAAGVGQRTVNLVTQSGDRFAPDVVVGRAADHCAAVIGFVSDCDDL